MFAFRTEGREKLYFYVRLISCIATSDCICMKIPDSVEVDNPTSPFSAPLPQLAQSPTKTREADPEGREGDGRGWRLYPTVPVWPAYPELSRVGLKLKGLGFTVSVLPPGTACLSAPSLLLRGRLGAPPKSRVQGECTPCSPECIWWKGCAAGGGVQAPL